jgi:MYXO-CTERM domain-containing protein
VDTGRVGRVIAGLVLVGMAVLVVILFVAAVHKNSQITTLRRQGVPVVITMTGCRGLLGGSGSNAAGYACRGSFTLDGRRYNEVIPGNTLHPPGTTLRGVTVPGDPVLVTTARMLAGEHSSGRVFVLPAILAVVALLLVGILVLRRRRRHA